MVRIYFDVDALQIALEATASEATVTLSTYMSIEYFNVYECAAKYGSYSFLGSYAYQPNVNYIPIQPVNDLDWFRISYVDTENGESDYSEPTIGDNLIDAVERVAIALGDTNREDETQVAFTDEEYIRKIKEAIKRYKHVDGAVPLTEADWSVIILLVRASCCYDLAYDTARYYRLELPDGTKLFKSEVTKHYLDLAKALEEQFKRLQEDLEDSLSGTPTFDVIDMTKKSYFNQIELNDRANLKSRIYG